MKLYALCSHGVWDDIQPLYNSDTGAPCVFATLEAAEKEMMELNRIDETETSDEYFIVTFETED